MGGIHWARGAQPPARPTKSSNLLYHGGDVMHGTLVEPIFWGSQWADSSFVVDKMTGLASFYEGIGGSSYADTNTEYSDATGAVSSGVTYGQAFTDFSAAPNSGNNTSPILAEVCSVLGIMPLPTATIQSTLTHRAGTPDFAHGTAPGRVRTA